MFEQRQIVYRIVEQAMIQGECDLHLHTHFSDGSDSPGQLVERVVHNRLKVFAITDHDTMSAIEPTRSYLAKISDAPLFIPGVELSVDFNDQEVHLLAYFVPGTTDPLAGFLAEQRFFRQKRNEEMLERLRDLGYPLTAAEFFESAQDVPGRVHAARLLVAKGLVKSIAQAFDLLLTPGRPAYVRRHRPPVGEVINVIQSSGGIAVLAHPAQYGWCKDRAGNGPGLIALLTKLKNKGLDGVEVYHGEASPAERAGIKAAAAALGLLATAGSDDHGLNKDRLLLYRGKDSEGRIIPL